MIYNVEDEAMTVIMNMLTTEDEQWELMEFMADHKTATTEEILRRAITIIKK